MDKRFTVQEGETSDVTIPVDFTYTGLGAAGRSLLNTGAVNYHVIGDVTVGSPVGNFTVPYSSERPVHDDRASRDNKIIKRIIP